MREKKEEEKKGRRSIKVWKYLRIKVEEKKGMRE